MYILALTCQYPAGQGTLPCGDGARAGRTRAGQPGNAPETPAGRCRADTAASRTGQARITPMAPARRPARRAGSIWRVSESFPELAQAVLEHAQPDRIDIVRAKRHLLGQLGDRQPHPTGTLIASVATLLGAEQLGRPQIALPSRDSVKTVVSGLFICTQDHDQRQRCLRGLPLTERYYPVGLTAAKPFRSPCRIRAGRVPAAAPSSATQMSQLCVAASEDSPYARAGEAPSCALACAGPACSLSDLEHTPQDVTTPAECPLLAGRLDLTHRRHLLAAILGQLEVYEQTL